MNSTQNIYIAVIDDDHRMCLAMSRLLRASSFQPVTYSSAEAFLTDTNRPKFACLVLDIQLQGMSGLELRKSLLAVKDFTPVIFVTELDNPQIKAQAKASGCAGYFSKTDSGTELLSALRCAINIKSG
jgi:FixJ family two-component response regulator